MSSDQKILSPARRTQRCRTSLIVLALLGTVASTPSEWTLADIFQSYRPDSKELISASHPPTAATTSVANLSTSKTSNTTPGSNLSAGSVVVKVVTTMPESGKRMTAGN